MNKGIVLVAVSTYNRPEYLRVFIESVLRQTYKEVRILISDNSTDDRTKEMVNSLFGDMVSYYRAGCGMSPSEHAIFLERYVKQFSYDFLVLSHDDDVMLENHIESSVNTLINNDISAVSTSAILIDDNDKKIGIQQLSSVFLDRKISGYWGVLFLCWINPMICPSIVRKRGPHCTPTSDYFSESLGYNDYTNNILTIFRSGVVISSEKSFLYRVHKGQDSKNFSDKHWSQHKKARNVAIREIDAALAPKLFMRLSFFALDSFYSLYKLLFKGERKK